MTNESLVIIRGFFIQNILYALPVIAGVNDSHPRMGMYPIQEWEYLPSNDGNNAHPRVGIPPIQGWECIPFSNGNSSHNTVGMTPATQWEYLPQYSGNISHNTVGTSPTMQQECCNTIKSILILLNAGTDKENLKMLKEKESGNRGTLKADRPSIVPNYRAFSVSSFIFIADFSVFILKLRKYL